MGAVADGINRSEISFTKFGRRSAVFSNVIPSVVWFCWIRIYKT